MMSFGQKDPREFREMEIDMMARKEQAKNMAAGSQDPNYQESKWNRIIYMAIGVVLVAAIVYIIFFA